MNKPKASLILMILLVGCMLISNCTRTPDTKGIELESTRLRYVEYVLECPQCSSFSSHEYILVDNGILFEKRSIDPYAKRAEVNIGRADAEKTKALLDQSEGFIRSSALADVDCEYCNSYRMYFSNGDSTLRYSETEELIPAEIKNIGMAFDRLKSSIVPSEEPFVQIVFTPRDDETQDYHIFSDGTVVYEEFGKRQGELIFAQVYKMKASDVAWIHDLIEPSFFQDEDSFIGCAKKGLTHGYVSIVKDDKYALVWTCGNEDNAASRIFNELYYSLKK